MGMFCERGLMLSLGVCMWGLGPEVIGMVVGTATATGQGPGTLARTGLAGLHYAMHKIHPKEVKYQFERT